MLFIVARVGSECARVRAFERTKSSLLNFPSFEASLAHVSLPVYSPLHLISAVT